MTVVDPDVLALYSEPDTTWEPWRPHLLAYGVRAVSPDHGEIMIWPSTYGGVRHSENHFVPRCDAQGTLTEQAMLIAAFTAMLTEAAVRGVLPGYKSPWG
jgi:hypothetical protein